MNLQRMKRMSLYFLVCIFLSSCAGSLCEKPGEILYTSHNIWYGRRTNILDAINFKSGNILPAGTKVEFLKCGIRHKQRIGQLNDPSELPYVDFKPFGFEKIFRVYLNKNNQRNLSIIELKERMLTPETFDELVEGLQEFEIEAIKQGKIVPGMSKKAVIISYGYPPRDDTPSLNANIWIYWQGLTKKFIVEFDENELTRSEVKLE